MRNDISVHRVVKMEKCRNQLIPEHRHFFFHYIYCLNGHTSVTVNGMTLLTGARTLVLVPPQTDHSILGLDVACSIDVKFSCSAAWKQELLTLPYFFTSLGDYEDHLLRAIFEEAVGQHEHYDELINLHLYELLILLLRRQHQSQGLWQEASVYPFSTDTDPQVQKILKLIESRLCQPLRIGDLAGELGYNKNYFQAFFKEHVGINPSAYINQRKISRAKKLMLYSHMNVTEISAYLGFQSIHYFSRLFKQLTGITPTEYIQRTKQTVSINVVKNEYTPAGQFEIPLQSRE